MTDAELPDEPGVLDDEEEALDWDLEERDEFMAKHGADTTPVEGVVELVAADE